jgi:hypothetical protein
MSKFCISCGTAQNIGARFCGSCGAAISDADNQATVATYSGPNWRPWGGGAAVLLLALSYYLIFIRDDVTPPAEPVVAKKPVEKQAVEAQYYAVADANVRDKPTTIGTIITAKVLRGAVATGSIITGADGTTPWLELAQSKGFVAMSNLAETQPPQIVKPLGDKIWVTDTPLDIWAQPDAAAVIVDRVAIGTPLTLFGLTANDYVEIKLKKGGVAYVAGGARIAALANIKGKPLAISFNPATCNFGGELAAEFGKLAAKSRAAFEVLDNKDYPSDEAREKALGSVEGKSYYQRIARQFNGLSVTGVAQHYETQSVYFADPPDKVIAAFKQAGYKIGRDGQFPSTDIYAGIGATGGDGKAYGKSDLSCGV